MATNPPARQGARARFAPPPRASALAGWALLPLRLFLGVTFTYAGLQKVANPNFFNSASPISIHAQLVAAARVSPIHVIVRHLEGLATPIGIVIALAEIAIGLGTLLGLWLRVAAAGGALLSFFLFLTVSFHAAPFYTGADLVFFFAWLPFVIAGSATRLSLDGLVAARAAAEARRGSPEVVAVPFAQISRLCGHYEHGRCAVRDGAPCEASRCPVLAEPSFDEADDVHRRAVVLATASAALVGGVTVLGAGVGAVVGRSLGGAAVPLAPNELGAPAGTRRARSALGILLGPVKDVPVGTAATFTIPATGDPGIVVQASAGVFDAYDAVCPHAGCTVGYYAQNHVLACPCHGSQFLLDNGEVISGPAPHGLAKLTVVEGPDGNLYLK